MTVDNAKHALKGFIHWARLCDSKWKVCSVPQEQPFVQTRLSIMSWIKWIIGIFKNRKGMWILLKEKKSKWAIRT